MNAFLFRRSSRIVVDALFVTGNRAPVYHLIDANSDVFLNGVSLVDQSPEAE
jgi:hypothetical protein